ncbi:MAG TPA: Uma2 family endonuclease [Thermoanaerobaculia bacterium]|jgi:Uma2 family endonuclease
MAPGTSTRLTYEDYLLLPEDGRRYEILDGELYVNASPLRKHQAVLRDLVFRIGAYLEEHPIGSVYFAPFDVVLSEHDVVQPDLLFISNEREQIITHKNVSGAPDLAVEILSESSRKTDEITKRKRYERFGVSEYWVMDPVLETVKVYRREGDRFARMAELSTEEGAALTSPLFPGLRINLTKVFAAR